MAWRQARVKWRRRQDAHRHIITAVAVFFSNSAEAIATPNRNPKPQQRRMRERSDLWESKPDHHKALSDRTFLC